MLVTWFYKITKIVRALWLAERSVCLRVCKHGCGVKLFGFSRANHASKVFEFKTQKVYFIYPFLRRLKLGKSLQRRCVHFSSLKLTVLSEKNPYFAKHLFAKQELITRARLRGQDFAAAKNFSFNQCLTKEFCVFFSGKLFYKSNRKLFSCVCIAWYKHSRRRVYIRLCKHGKRFLLLL